MQEQVINDWKIERLGRFTSSQISKLFEGGRRDMTEEEKAAEKERNGKRKTVDLPFGEGAMKYIKEKAAEIITGEAEPEPFSRALEWGKEHEAEAFTLYSKQYPACSFEYFGCANPKFIEYGAFAGGSPDGSIRCKEGYGVLEIKCPYTTKEHIGHLLIGNGKELKDYCKEYYTQVQANILFCNADFAHFISYDPRITDASKRLHRVVVDRDKEFIKTLKERIELAGKELNALLEKLGY